MGTLYCTLENEADLYVNEHQKIRRHYRARSTEERRRKIRRKKKNAKSCFFNSRVAYIKLRCYTLLRLEISHRTRWWCLKCVIVYLARVIPAFVMYYVNGASCSSLYTNRVYRLYDILSFSSSRCTAKVLSTCFDRALNFTTV